MPLVQRLPSGAVVSIANGQVINIPPQSIQSAPTAVQNQSPGTVVSQLTSANLGQQIDKSRTATIVNVSQGQQMLTKITNPLPQLPIATIQRLPCGRQQISGLGHQTLIHRGANPTLLSPQINASAGNIVNTGVIRGASSINTATILAGGQQISIQPRPSSANFLTGGATTGAVTLTVTSVSPSPMTAAPVGQQVSQGGAQRQGLPGTQAQVTKPGLPIVLSLSGHQHVLPLSGLQRVAGSSGPLTSQSSPIILKSNGQLALKTPAVVCY